VWKRHPLGGLIGLGTSPFKIIGLRTAPGCGTGTAEPTWFSPDQNIENNPMQSSVVSLAWMLERILRNIFDTSGKSGALFHHRRL